MELLVASLVNLFADCVWFSVLLGGWGVETPAAETPRGQLPSERDLVEVQAGRMTVAEFNARMAARK